jgi:hypothetical protein
MSYVIMDIRLLPQSYRLKQVRLMLDMDLRKYTKM